MLATAATASALPMVLTIDDGPSLAALPRLAPDQRHAALRETLSRHGITAVMYVTLGFGADRPEGRALARAWAAAGHLLGNHTVSHLDLDDDAVTLARYLDEIRACDAAMADMPGWRRWFRATYLHEGASAAKREGLRRFLAEQGYRLAPVNLDSLDWRFAPRLETLMADPQADGAALKAEFLAQLVERARALPAVDGPAVLLVHDNLLTALWLEDALRALREAGYSFVHPDAAMHGTPSPWGAHLK
jgi:peptidoglycan/xylan/chitin deacetylase (PgdA/CDA1 family)